MWEILGLKSGDGGKSWKKMFFEDYWFSFEIDLVRDQIYQES